MVIYLTGIDGSGKSTITGKLASEVFIDREFETIWARYKPNIIKVIVSPFKRKFTVDTENDHLMDGVEYSDWSRYKRNITKHRVVSQLFYLLQTLDYLIQLKKHNRAIRNHTDRLIIIDRYLLDFIVDQSVNYGNIENSRITRYLLKKLQKLDIIFFIDTPEELAFSRKHDIPSIEYLKERRDYYKQYISKLKNAHIINNSDEIAGAMDEITSIIVSKQ
jgi:thymidylate kinase